MSLRDARSLEDWGRRCVNIGEPKGPSASVFVVRVYNPRRHICASQAQLNNGTASHWIHLAINDEPKAPIKVSVVFLIVD